MSKRVIPVRGRATVLSRYAAAAGADCRRDFAIYSRAKSAPLRLGTSRRRSIYPSTSRNSPLDRLSSPRRGLRNILRRTKPRTFRSWRAALRSARRRVRATGPSRAYGGLVSRPAERGEARAVPRRPLNGLRIGRCRYRSTRRRRTRRPRVRVSCGIPGRRTRPRNRTRILY